MANLQLDPEPLLKLHWTQGTSWGFHFTFVKAQLLKAKGPSWGPMYPCWDTFVLLTWAMPPHMGSPEGNGPTGPALTWPQETYRVGLDPFLILVSWG